jgi:BirA family transcriptional regulator, biotin operon repressor / biotin---[acetyl-CoA-carboxylase] ligase
MTAAVPIDEWPDRLERAIADCAQLKRIFVLRETDSTQDAAQRMNAIAGDVFIAWRQTAGRGRFGRTWTDTAEDGVAITIALAAPEPRESLSIVCAIGVARGAESLLKRKAGIKWPNDIIVDNRKLAGILIERYESLALIGVGMNVRQTAWPNDLASRAISLLQAGVNVDRVDVIAALLHLIDCSLRLNHQELIAEFTSRDVLHGTHAVFRNKGAEISGIVSRIDPLRGLMVQTQKGEVWLDAATTSVVPQES